LLIATLIYHFVELDININEFNSLLQQRMMYCKMQYDSANIDYVQWEG
jgi:hypothetical protein